MTNNKELKKEKSEFDKLLEVISGEKNLREKEAEIKKAKTEAKKREKQKRRDEIVQKEVKLEEDLTPKKSIVQNIKLFEWTAPDRRPVQFNNRGFLIVVIFALAFALFLAILRNYLLMAAIMSVLFLLYVAGTTEPVKVKHKITARGIDIGGKLYEWYVLEKFFFTKKEDTIFLILETKLNFPRSMILLVEKPDKDAIFVLLQEKILYKDIRKWGKLDKISYGEYIPLEEV